MQKQNGRLRSPLFSGVWSLVTGSLAPDKTFRRFMVRPKCRLETPGTNHPVTQSHNPEEAPLRKLPAGVVNSRGCVNVQTQSANGTECPKILVLSGCRVFHISSGLVKFHVLSHSYVRIPLRPYDTAIHTLRSPPNPLPPSSFCPRLLTEH